MNEFMRRRLEFINSGRPLPQKKKYVIPKVSEKRKQKLKEQSLSGDSALDKWFEDRRREMTGRCQLCGGKTEKDNDETYRRSIHHLFEKRPTMFPSVATHPDNFLEVCFFGNACHTNIHNGNITWELLMDSAEREMILEKCRKVIPYIAAEEQRLIPEIIIKALGQ